MPRRRHKHHQTPPREGVSPPPNDPPSSSTNRIRRISGEVSSFLSEKLKKVTFRVNPGFKATENGTMKPRQPADYYLPPSGRGLKSSPSMATLNRLDRRKITLWRKPLVTLQYFILELLLEIRDIGRRLWASRRAVFLTLLVSFALYFAYTSPGKHQLVIQYVEKKMLWCLRWLGLGILSSIGLGTGLHTFLLYLGPHIASVTLAAYECDSLKFPEPPYPDQIICPYDSNSTAEVMNAVTTGFISLWSIISKVRLEAFMWGAGTALGELPPYFMARAARLSGEEPDDEEYQEFKQFLQSSGQNQKLTRVDRLKLMVEKLVERVGFLGILLCASIPNPVFDLAGITCGHFLVPFWTFFGATLVGKAVVKMHIQKIFVIVMFSERHVEKVIRLLSLVPKVGSSLEAPFQEYLRKQKMKLHRKPGEEVSSDSSLLSILFGWIVAGFIIYFVLSIINSLAQSYHKRLWERERDLVKKT